MISKKGNDIKSDSLLYLRLFLISQAKISFDFIAINKVFLPKRSLNSINKSFFDEVKEKFNLPLKLPDEIRLPVPLQNSFFVKSGYIASFFSLIDFNA